MLRPRPLARPLADGYSLYQAAMASLGWPVGHRPPMDSGRTRIPSVNHDPQIPTAAKGLATNMGLLALWGPGIRRGYRRTETQVGPARMCAAAPTLASLLGCAPPRQAEGVVLLDMLEGS